MQVVCKKIQMKLLLFLSSLLDSRCKKVYVIIGPKSTCEIGILAFLLQQCFSSSAIRTCMFHAC
jgi:hypothetical protein